MRSLLVRYETLCAAQRQQLLQIEVQDEQRAWVGDIHGALHALTARPASDIQGYVLLVDEVPRGFLLLKRRSLLPRWANVHSATLHGLIVDHRYQGLGLGKACVQGLAQQVANLWPEIEHLMLAVHPANTTALKLYQNLGWALCDDTPSLPTDPERRMMLSLR